MSIDAPIDYPESVDAADHDADYYITGAGVGCNNKIVHLPASESTRDNPVTRCQRMDADTNRFAKDPAVYPSGYRTVCRQCLRYKQLEGDA